MHDSKDGGGRATQEAKAEDVYREVNGRTTQETKSSNYRAATESDSGSQSQGLFPLVVVDMCHYISPLWLNELANLELRSFNFEMSESRPFFLISDANKPRYVLTRLMLSTVISITFHSLLLICIL